MMRAANALFAQSPARGALPMVYAATADVTPGAYVGPGGLLNMRGSPTEQEPSEAAKDPADARRLWAWSREATGETFPFEET